MRLVFPDLEIDLDARQVRCGRGSDHLTEREAEALRYLAQRAGEVVPRERLERDVWHFRPGVRSEAVPMAMRRLRAKIEVDPQSPSVLLTVQGRGWRLQRPQAPSVRIGAPGFATPFQGRSVHQRAIRSWFDAGHRLVTLVGPGGAGKTRLAAAAGANPPCVFVDLEGCATAGRVAAATARAIDVSASLSVPDLARLLGSEGLVVLDHAEQAVAAVAELVSAALARTSSVRFLVTSRVALGVPGEVVHEVGGLTEPEAVALLTARLMAAGAPAPSPARALEVIRALDGLPLALELCAGPLSQLGDEAPLAPVLARVLDGGVGATLAWSWSQLSAGEQRLLVGCTVFPSEFDLSSVVRILGPEAGAGLDVLRRLWLVQRRGNRFRLAAAVRAFTAGIPLPAELLDAHARWVVDEARARMDQLLVDPVPACERLSELRADLDVVAERGDPESVAWVTLCLTRWSRFDGGPPEPPPCDAVADQALPPYLRARVNLARITVATNRGDLVLASTLWASLGDPETPLPWLDLEVLRQVDVIRRAVHAGDLETAGARIDQMVVQARIAGETLPLSDALYWAGVVAQLRGDFAASDQHWAEAISVMRRSGHVSLVPRFIAARGVSLSRMGESVRARALFEEAAASALATCQRVGATTALRNLHAEFLIDDPLRAAAYLVRAADFSTTLIDHITLQFTLGMARYLGGDVEGAFQAAHPWVPEIGRLPAYSAAEAKLFLATILAAWGDAAEAEAMFGALDRAQLKPVYPQATDTEVDLLMALLYSELDVVRGRHGDREARARAEHQLEVTRTWSAANRSTIRLLQALVVSRTEAAPS